jgi:hypothetical protein
MRSAVRPQARLVHEAVQSPRARVRFVHVRCHGAGQDHIGYSLDLQRYLRLK